MEMAVNCDLVIASERAEFGLPEVKRGVFAKQGVSLYSLFLNKCDIKLILHSRRWAGSCALWGCKEPVNWPCLEIPSVRKRHTLGVL